MNQLSLQKAIMLRQTFANFQEINGVRQRCLGQLHSVRAKQTEH